MAFESRPKGPGVAKDAFCGYHKGEEGRRKAMYRYFLFYKPFGCVTARRDDRYPTVMDWFRDLGNEDLSPVGRLDRETEGLLLVTNDGMWNRKMTLLPVVSFVYLLLVFFSFRMYQKMESIGAVAGMKTEYYFTLKNESIFPFAGVRVKMYSDFSYVENMKEDTEYELLKGDEYTFETNMICKYRGEYQVGIKEVIITDFLRLFRLKYK